MIGKWMYNTGSEEHWNCDEGEFDTKEEAIAAGIAYYTDSDGYGYEYHNDEKFERESFNVGLIAYPSISISPWHVIEMAQDQAYEQCGDHADNWLDKPTKEEEKLLSEMLTNSFNEWIQITNNNPRFYTIEKVQTIKLVEN